MNIWVIQISGYLGRHHGHYDITVMCNDVMESSVVSALVFTLTKYASRTVWIFLLLVIWFLVWSDQQRARHWQHNSMCDLKLAEPFQLQQWKKPLHIYLCFFNVICKRYIWLLHRDYSDATWLLCIYLSSPTLFDCIIFSFEKAVWQWQIHVYWNRLYAVLIFHSPVRVAWSVIVRFDYELYSILSPSSEYYFVLVEVIIWILRGYSILVVCGRS